MTATQPAVEPAIDSVTEPTIETIDPTTGRLLATYPVMDDAAIEEVLTEVSSGSAADVEEIVRAHGFDHADYVLSGLPFSTLPDGVGPEIAAATHRVLRPGGAFLVYQFSAAARDFMAKHFARIDSGFEALNVLPCRLFWGWKD